MRGMAATGIGFLMAVSAAAQTPRPFQAPAQAVVPIVQTVAVKVFGRDR